MYVTIEDKKYIKALEKYKRQIKLIDLQEIDRNVSRKHSKFLEDILIDTINIIQYLILYGRQNEIAEYIKMHWSQLETWLHITNKEGTHPIKYNGLYNYHYENIGQIMGVPTPAKDAAFSDTEVAQLFEQIANKKKEQALVAVPFQTDYLKQLLEKDKLEANGDYMGISDKSVGKKLNAALNKIIIECINLYHQQKLTQKKIDQLFTRLHNRFEDDIFELDTEDRDYIKELIDEIAINMGFRNFVF